MEMHQVRYFLAVSRTLNFTRAAEECNVTQPSLTRAIKQLEGELGGDLFQRERPHARLTELGERMLPLLTQCYDSALSARSLASSFKSGEVGTLKVALSRTIDMGLLIPHLMELQKLFDNLQFKFQRGTKSEVGEMLKNGEVELGIAADIGSEWERIDSWPLFTERFAVVVGPEHEFANREAVEFYDLRNESLLKRNYCEHAAQLETLLRDREVDIDHAHELSSEHDLLTLIKEGFGIALVPASTTTPESSIRLPLKGLDFSRTIHLYGVAGRQRTAVATAVMKMLRAADWSRYAD
jgi:DNA-binding transcriptional LysR family regulator